MSKDILEKFETPEVVTAEVSTPAPAPFGALTIGTPKTLLELELDSDGSGALRVTRGGQPIVEVGWEAE